MFVSRMAEQGEMRRPRTSWLVGTSSVFALLPISLLAGCASQPPPPPPAAFIAPTPPAPVPSIDPRLGVAPSPRLVSTPEHRIPAGGGGFKIGKPYQVAGRWYVPRDEPGYDRSGIASWYGSDFHGRKTANGEIFDMEGLSAAHPTLPLPSYVLVTNLQNDRTVVVRVNDRGPYVHGRIIDLSKGAARELGLERSGTGQVRVKYYARAPLDGDSSFERAYLASQPWRSQTRLAQQQPGPRAPQPLAGMRAPQQSLPPTRSDQAPLLAR